MSGSKKSCMCCLLDLFGFNFVKKLYLVVGFFLIRVCIGQLSQCLKTGEKKYCIRETLCPLVCVLFRSTNTIPWVWVITMSQCIYNESMSIPWVHVFTMSLCLYHESMSIPWVHVCTRILILYHESMSIPGVFVKSMLPFLYHEKYSFQIYINTINKNKEILISELQKYNLQIYINTNYSNTEIQNTKLKKYNLQKFRNTNDILT